MAQIKTSLNHEKGSSRTTSFGTIKFDEKGIAEVELEVAKALVKISPSIHMLDEQGNVEPAKVIKKPAAKVQQTGPIETTTTPPPTIVVNQQNDSQGEDSATAQSEENVVTEDDSLNEEAIAEIRETLEGKSMDEIRQTLVESGVDVDEFTKDEFKGKEGKPALIEFTIEKITSKKD